MVRAFIPQSFNGNVPFNTNYAPQGKQPSATFNDESYVINGVRGITSYVIGGVRGVVDYQDLI